MTPPYPPPTLLLRNTFSEGPPVKKGVGGGLCVEKVSGGWEKGVRGTIRSLESSPL